MTFLTAILGFELSKQIKYGLLKKSDEKNNKIPVHVVGNGWGAYNFVKNLDKNKFEPIIIAPNNKVLDTPKLTNKAINNTVSVEFDNRNSKIITDKVEDIDHKNNKIITSSNNIIEYKYLVLAIGSEPNDFGISGVNTYTYKLKSINDADKIREKLTQINHLSTIYIVGSGVTGIELASKLNSIGCKIKIIEGMNSILPGFSKETKNYIFNHFKNNYKNIDINLNTSVKSINENEIVTNSNTFVFDNKSDFIVWTGGVRFNEYNKSKLFNTLNYITPIKPRGLYVNPNFTIGNLSNIFCIGDMVANPGPPTAQNARLQSEWLAKYFNSNFDPEYEKNNKFESNITTKLIHLKDKLYLESKYYSGFIPKWIDNIIDKFNK